MIRLMGSTQHLTAVAVSGGIDSMAALSFLRGGNPAIKAAYFHHGTSHGEEALLFLREYCEKQHIKLLVGHISRERPKDLSQEEHWRIERYDYLHSLPETIVTAHHLNDAAESSIMGFIRGGTPRMIRYHFFPNIYRPFLRTPKSKLESWCQRHSVPWIDDPSNVNVEYDRNRVRHRILPEILEMNPGFLKQVARNYEIIV